jgi:hypothetical protein
MDSIDHLRNVQELLISDLKEVHNYNNPEICMGDTPFSPIIISVLRVEIRRLSKAIIEEEDKLKIS